MSQDTSVDSNVVIDNNKGNDSKLSNVLMGIR